MSDTQARKKVVIGLSGGVDSAVSAYLLKERGYDVHAVFMKNWEEDDTEDFCSAAQDIADASAVCEKLDIPFNTINFATEYWDDVFEHFLAEYAKGRTPNPDILCNREIKFKAFRAYAKTLGADAIATGHYAKLKRDPDGQVSLCCALDSNKDQTYFLYALKQSQLSDAIFPLGEIDKPTVRAIAEKLSLPVYDKKDSTGICFIGERKFKTFLSQYLPANPGDIITDTGDIIGRHDGLMYYTIGQRQGLQIGGLKDYPDAPWYVAGKDLDSNQLIVVQGADHPALFAASATVTDCTWVNDAHRPIPGKIYQVKTRYRQRAIDCTIDFDAGSDKMLVTFTSPTRAVTPGQSVVVYDQDICLGGGIIDA